MTTFQELGLDFPLFDGSVEDSSEYIGEGTCTLCQLPKAHCFELGIGEDVILPCPACQAPNALDADDQEDGLCSACGAVIPFPATEGSVNACFDCVREGKAAFTHDTELGMVRWEDAQRGLTHGRPGISTPDITFSFNEDGWSQAHLPAPVLLELIWTPNYLSWQGENWLFCHQQPMVYLGKWSQEDFQRLAPDQDGRTFFFQVVESGDGYVWESMNSASVGVYVFRCQACRRLRAHYDFD